ncbi:FtsX-like permease family protein [Streptomyces formicae]|uniref:Putative integral membrane protein n=1 Tax=Streptomyces formicae TaxID=1616117 RepID=A0A291QF44_9ACTN|nr:FtsX-like permease family protein [Streptomyces formicae]ATL30178.1 putative integral membrane protein [Streptomyces formicae]
MSGTHVRSRTPIAAPTAVAPTGAAAWVRDLGMGMRFATGGGREGWIRTILTAVGVGLGVALLLGAASVPNMMQNRDDRSVARTPHSSFDGGPVKASDSTVVIRNTGTTFRGKSPSGVVLRADGKNPVLPPGLDKIPGPDEMVVSPAMRDLLDDPANKLLKERFSNYRVTGTIGKAGLLSPVELYYYVGSDKITATGNNYRVQSFGQDNSLPLDPFLMALVVLICVVLLTPVAIFIGTAVRFGGDRRDRRLAALRLVGADSRAVRRIAAGEALFGALLGLVVGAALFLLLRELVGVVDMTNVSAYPTDMVPSPGLVALVAAGVPVSAVLVTLISLRSVAIEPLGVFRGTKQRKRRLWWRLVLPVLGIGILLYSGRIDRDMGNEAVNVTAIAAGSALSLIGLSALLPWLVEAVVGRLRGGPVPWQLAVRRLQLTTGTASRAVSGITVAVAGAVALQMMFASMHDDFNEITGQDTTRAQLTVRSGKASGPLTQQMIDDFAATKGVTKVIGTVQAFVTRPDGKKVNDLTPTTEVTIGTCATLRELAHLRSCEDGDAFVVHTGSKEQDGWVDQTARPGKPVNIGPDPDFNKNAKQVLWTLPKDTRTVDARNNPSGRKIDGIFATPSAIDIKKLDDASTTSWVQTDPKVADAEEYVRNTAARIDPFTGVDTLKSVDRDKQYASIARGLQIGASATMALIAASMLVSMIEQLRERKRLLAVLTAFGTRRSSMGWSLLWQTALPVALGLGLAIVGGLGLGVVMTRMIDKGVTDWWSFLPLTGAGAAMVAIVTLLSLPPLRRMMRPDGLRTE